MKELLEQMEKDLMNLDIEMDKFEVVFKEDKTPSKEKVKISKEDFRKAVKKIVETQNKNHKKAKINDLTRVSLGLEVADFSTRLEDELFKKKPKPEDTAHLDNFVFEKAVDEAIKEFDSGYVYKNLDYKKELKSIANKLKKEFGKTNIYKLTRKEFREKVADLGIKKSNELVKKYKTDIIFLTDDIIEFAESIENKIF